MLETIPPACMSGRSKQKAGRSVEMEQVEEGRRR